MSAVCKVVGSGDQVEPASLVRRFLYSSGTEFSYLDYLALNGAIKERDQTISQLPVLRVALLRNITIEPLLPVLAGEIVRSGFQPEFYVGDFDTIAADIFDDRSAFYRFDPHFVILTQWLEGLRPVLANR